MFVSKFHSGFCEFSLQQATGYTTSFVTDAINEIVSGNNIKDIEENIISFYHFL